MGTNFHECFGCSAWTPAGVPAAVFGLFDDARLGFVYVDVYAHRGNEGGETLANSIVEKVLPSGILAGDDYHSKRPKNLAAVDASARPTPIRSD